MEKEFWKSRWESNQIGFHLNEFNPKLIAFFPRLQLIKNNIILVPFCGKTKDLLYLEEQGLVVIGVELSSLAVECFFAENNLSYKKSSESNFEVYQCQEKNITLYCGDFFTFTKINNQTIDAIYDRAALIALPPEMRVSYSEVINSFLSKKARLLLITITYQENIEGPPFSVPESDVNRYYNQYKIEILDNKTSPNVSEKFKDASVSQQVYLIKN